VDFDGPAGAQIPVSQCLKLRFPDPHRRKLGHDEEGTEEDEGGADEGRGEGHVSHPLARVRAATELVLDLLQQAIEVLQAVPMLRELTMDGLLLPLQNRMGLLLIRQHLVQPAISASLRSRPCISSSRSPSCRVLASPSFC
jgi:hypothetical protein